MKPLLVAALALSMIAAADAKNKGSGGGRGKGGGGKGGGNNKEEVAKKAEEDKKKDEERKAVDHVLVAKDKNHDGSLTVDEYIAGEASAETATRNFLTYDVNRSRKLEKSEIAASLGF